MPRPHRPWIVTPHQPIEKHDDNLWSVEGQVPGIPFSRRMVIVKRSDGSLLFFHAIPLEDSALQQVLAWGKPAVLVIAHDKHGIDADAFSQKLGVKLYGPARQEKRLRAHWDLAGTVEQLPPDPAISFEPMAGTRAGEPVGIVRTGNRVSLLFADAYQDSKDLPFFLRLLGFGNGPKVVPAFKHLFTSDRAALRAHFERLAALPGLTRIIPCHGPALTTDPAGTLRRVAAAI
ncbi:MAG: Methanol oxidation glmU-like protein [Myxococcaceae bacterium]|nr:Methanol oxidation glmU-like protein [Myxococcaceae bacterium]